MALLFPAGQQFFTSNGDVVASGTLTAYDTGTTNYRAIYSDPEMTVQLSNPLDLDAAGRITTNVYGSGVYTLIVSDSDTAVVFSRDDVYGWQSPGELELSLVPVADDSIAIGTTAKRLSEVRTVDLYVGAAVSITSGTATPEAAVTAPVGSLYLRTDGDGDTTIYSKVSGSGNTGWQAIHTDLLTGSKTHDFGSLADGAGETTTVTVTGAALGDFAEASLSVDLQSMTMTAWVSAADTVSVRVQNESGGGPIDLGSATLRARVRKA
jgi:hypothetical protein